MVIVVGSIVAVIALREGVAVPLERRVSQLKESLHVLDLKSLHLNFLLEVSDFLLVGFNGVFEAQLGVPHNASQSRYRLFLVSSLVCPL